MTDPETTMEYAIPCNWDEGLIDVARRHRAGELYGKLAQDFVGGGRPAAFLPAISRRRARRYIRRVRDAGMEFNYLLSGTTMGLQELTRAGQRELRDLMAWAWDSGARRFSVAIPYLGAILKRSHPDAELVTSILARVDSVEVARQWEESGAQTLVVFNNKDFKLIKAVKQQTGLRVEVTANLSCLGTCSQAGYHANTDSLSSNRAGLGLYSMPVCEVRCNYLKVKEPRRIIAAQWMRPRDQGIWADMGVDRLKFVDRLSTTEQLDRILGAYRAGRWDGNLAELIPGYRQGRVEQYMSPARMGRMVAALLRPDRYNVSKARQFLGRSKPPGIHIDGDALDGYLDRFLEQDCRGISCDACRWCEKYGETAVRFDPAERARYLEGAEENLDDLESGDLFL